MPDSVLVTRETTLNNANKLSATIMRIIYWSYCFSSEPVLDREAELLRIMQSELLVRIRPHIMGDALRGWLKAVVSASGVLPEVSRAGSQKGKVDVSWGSTGRSWSLLGTHILLLLLSIYIPRAANVTLRHLIWDREKQVFHIREYSGYIEVIPLNTYKLIFVNEGVIILVVNSVL